MVKALYGSISLSLVDPLSEDLLRLSSFSTQRRFVKTSQLVPIHSNHFPKPGQTVSFQFVWPSHRGSIMHGCIVWGVGSQNTFYNVQCALTLVHWTTFRSQWCCCSCCKRLVGLVEPDKKYSFSVNKITRYFLNNRSSAFHIIPDNNLRKSLLLYVIGNI